MFAPLEQSIIGRARASGKIEINIVNFRDFTNDKHKRVDDTAFGGGAGMVIMAQPVVDCIEFIDPNHDATRIFLTPAAPVLTQAKAIALSQKKHIILLCGHYEGVDQRAIDLCIDEVISIGDYVLTGGELAAMVLTDAVARHVDGVISSESLVNESFSNPDNLQLLEHPQYTKPREFRGLAVPDVLLNGNHAEIQKWKVQQSKHVTKKYRGVE